MVSTIKKSNKRLAKRLTDLTNLSDSLIGKVYVNLLPESVESPTINIYYWKELDETLENYLDFLLDSHLDLSYNFNRKDQVSMYNAFKHFSQLLFVLNDLVAFINKESFYLSYYSDIYKSTIIRPKDKISILNIANKSFIPYAMMIKNSYNFDSLMLASCSIKNFYSRSKTYESLLVDGLPENLGNNWKRIEFTFENFYETLFQVLVPFSTIYNERRIMFAHSNLNSRNYNLYPATYLCKNDLDSMIDVKITSKSNSINAPNPFKLDKDFNENSQRIAKKLTQISQILKEVHNNYINSKFIFDV